MTAIPRKKQISLGMEQTEKLLEQAIEGSESTFRQLVLSQHQNVRVYLSRFIYCSDQVDDLAQEVFLAAYQQLSKFRKEAKFSTWLLGIARNKAMQHLRSESRRKKHRQKYIDTTVLCQRLKCIAEETLESQEAKITALKDCVSNLPDHARNLVRRFYFQRIATQKIANEEQKNDGAIRMKLFRIRKKLASCVSSKTADHQSED